MDSGHGFVIIRTSPLKPEDLKAVPSIGHFVKITEDDMRVLGKHRPPIEGYSSLLVINWQGNETSDTDIYEDVLFD